MGPESNRQCREPRSWLDTYCADDTRRHGRSETFFDRGADDKNFLQARGPLCSHRKVRWHPKWNFYERDVPHLVAGQHRAFDFNSITEHDVNALAVANHMLIGQGIGGSNPFGRNVFRKHGIYRVAIGSESTR